ncbi:hypothetical protein FC83_GL003073 [Agrilactobacillus composti DSM 18527 = JCM 14202]|uniref:Dihydrodipicolinate synthase n=1 Tax=Agrilactobacillus composti DSM 18527 = JCM 14202 TaxID=1423734 RepID=X0PVD8_9LACO|nr:dihydrodipicolinate synthase family protein [Agrilactobacillus composti]KRM36318.1 hypothetical protein FC83_GL003073 [Agrilactobacillus composti DSM 18527 = JCM 14202]GAF41441.1 dihydrodipicolinate synthase [Agrilactobacillus composti DSM 18527 = JCM 14202]
MAKIITAVITVFDKNEQPDLAGNKAVIDFLIDHGVDGILILGSTGEFPNFTLKERLEYMQFYADYVAGRVELYCGTGCISYQDTLLLTKKSHEFGFTSSMIIGPYYFALDQAHIFRFYDRLANDVISDFYLYNFPARTGHSIAPETIGRLVHDHSNIIGLKDSVSEAGHTNMVFRMTETEPFNIFSGFDDQFLLNIANHGAGCIGGLSNIVPDIWHDLVYATNERNFDQALKLTNLIQRLMPLYDMDATSSILFKKLMVHRGLSIAVNDVIPFDEIDLDDYKRAEALLDKVLQTYNKM